MTQSEVERNLGRPDSVRGNYDSSSVWYYYSRDKATSKSKIPFVIFKNGMVYFSSDEDELYFNDSAANIHVDSVIWRKTLRDKKDYSVKNFNFEVFTTSVVRLQFMQSERRVWAYVDSGCCGVDSIRISRKEGGYFQTIVPGDNCTYNREDPLEIEDMDFDGFEDIGVIVFLPAGPNVPYFYWVYDQRNQRFRRDMLLEEITMPRFDKANRLITSFWRENAGTHGSAVYKYINGRPVKIMDTIETYDDEGYINYKVSKRVGGKMKVVLRYRVRNSQ